LNAEAPGISIIRSFDKRTVVYQGEKDVIKILEWMKQLSIPTLFEYKKAFESLIFENLPLGPFGAKNSEQYHPTIILFTDLSGID